MKKKCVECIFPLEQHFFLPQIIHLRLYLFQKRTRSLRMQVLFMCSLNKHKSISPLDILCIWLPHTWWTSEGCRQGPWRPRHRGVSSIYLGGGMRISEIFIVCVENPRKGGGRHCNKGKIKDLKHKGKLKYTWKCIINNIVRNTLIVNLTLQGIYEVFVWLFSFPIWSQQKLQLLRINRRQNT